MARPIIDIDVNDEKFKKFLDMFKSYQDQLGKMKGFWVDADKAVKETEASTESMVGVVAAIGASTALITEAMTKTEASTTRTATTMGKVAGHAKSAAGWILDATRNLAKWAALSLGAGLIGGGAGLFGLDRLAEAVSGQRRAAQGLGVSSGELQAFEVNFGSRLGLGGGFLHQVQDVRFDLGQKWQLQGLGISPSEIDSGDNAALSADVIKNAHRLWRQAGPQGHNTSFMQANGLGWMSPDQWQTIGAQSEGDINKWTSQFRRDSGSMGASDATQRAWQDFAVQMERAGKQIEAIFVKGLEPLTPGLTKLSESIERALAGFLGNPHMKEWIEGFGKAIEGFATYLGTDKFQQNIKDFADGIEYAVHAVHRIGQFLHVFPQDATNPAEAPYDPNAAATTGALPSIYNHHWFDWRLPGTPGRGMDFVPLEQSQQIPPGLLASLGMQESGLNSHPKDTFDAGEWHKGMFQMSDSMRARLGVTDAYDSDQEAKAAAREEHAYLERFKGNVAKAIAAWNEGPHAVDKQVEQAAKNGGDWLDYASPGVRKYVAEVAARMNIQVQVLNQTGAQVAIIANGARQ